ncbi:MAG: CoA pyrophosphatase [Myxococcota bacterium]|nr:CoA pyrophosphatase [Myxococcota bacterium]
MVRDLTESLDLLARAVRIRAPRRVDARQPGERAAVAIIARPGGELLFIRRSEHEGDPWSGHMAFPGGKMESADISTRAAAAREACEEVGLDPERGTYLGPLDDLESPARIARRRLVITPHVWVLQEAPQLRPNGEVAGIHWFGLSRLVSGEGRGEFTYRWRGQPVQLPVVRLESREIWGLTLRIVDDLLERVAALEPA